MKASGETSGVNHSTVIADADGNVVLTWLMHRHTIPGQASLQLTNTKADGTSIIVTHPYNVK
jgi:hypothetical protein